MVEAIARVVALDRGDQFVEVRIVGTKTSCREGVQVMHHERA